MNKLHLSLALSVLTLAACSSTSGPTFSASELKPRNGGVRTFQVDCHGLFSSSNTCMSAAQDICGDQPVRVIDSAKSLRNDAPPATLVFQCGAAPVAAVPAAPVPAAPVPVAPTPAPVEHVNLSGDAYFATGKSTLRPNARESLDKLLSDLGDRPVSRVSVTGYTDSVGSDASNLRLSQRRAEAVASYLRDHGLKAGSFVAIGRGRADPVATNATPEGRASNRRVEISLQH
ncbi:OmpA family protein [Burkholderia ubonensis]|uniref:OmpA family protein n=1 Tax=Burkholderia ubonensis TaxID=101571 RepID=UPI0009B352A0|nr:OmpA family protein [Burkholderia ubonensis]